MNTTNSTDTQETAHLEKLRSQISTDIEVMQQKETSLREYEQRLRQIVDQAHQSRAPQAVDERFSRADLDAEWEKYDRAHALLEAARRGLTDDRLAFKEREEKMTLREVEVTRREAWVKVREQELDALVKAQAAPKQKNSLTAAPFIAARNLFMPRKA